MRNNLGAYGSSGIGGFGFVFGIMAIMLTGMGTMYLIIKATQVVYAAF